MIRAVVVSMLIAIATPAAHAQERILVFAAASLRNALDEVNAAHDAQAKTRTVASYAASSALAKQIESGAPAHVFISADLDWMDYVEKKSLIQKGTRRNLLANRLVLVAPADSELQTTIAPNFPLARLLGPGGRLALADPQHVPAGRYAKAALEKLGVWDSIANRVAALENVRAALALVARGEAPLGIVYETDANAEPKTRVVARFDPALHSPIVYPVALTIDAKSGAPAQYLGFLGDARARAIFEKHGFTPLR